MNESQYNWVGCHPPQQPGALLFIAVVHFGMAKTRLKQSESQAENSTSSGPKITSYKPGTPRPTIYKWMEMVISNHFLYKDLVHHPTETSM